MGPSTLWPGAGPASVRSVVVVDTETSGLHQDDGALVSTVAWAFRDPKSGALVAEALPFGQGKPNLLDPTDAGRERWDELMIWLSVQDLVFHNAKFDLHMLGAGSVAGHPGVEMGKAFYWDTMVAQRHLDPLEPVGLDHTARRLLNRSKTDIADYLKKHRIKHHQAPWDVMQPYAVGDVVMTLLLYELQMQRLADPEEVPSYEWLLQEMEVTRTLYRMEQRGIGFRAADCLADSQPIKVEMDRLVCTLPFKPTLAKARSFYFDEPPKGLGLLWHKATAGTKDSNRPLPALDEEVRRQLVQADAPHAKEYDRWCQLETAWTMWYQAWPQMTGADGRLRTQYRQTKVVSGRFSVERVQLQAIPHDYQLSHLAELGVPTMRSYFEAKPGHRLWELDVSQAEVRVATWWAGCKAMKAAILAGEDSHDTTCRLIYGIDKDHPDWKRKRSIAKRIRLGTIYGGGAGKIREEILRLDGIDFDVDELRILIDTDRRVFPEFRSASVRAQTIAEREGVVQLAGGGYRWFTDFERTRDAHKAFNQVIQGSVAQVMNRWMLAVEDQWPGTMLLQIHDSLVLELPEEDDAVAHEAADLGAKTFESFFDMPFTVDAKEWE